MPLHLLRRPEAQPSLDECWEAPPKFRQGLENEEKLETVAGESPPGLNAQWRVELCLFKRTGLLRLPHIRAHCWARVRHSLLTLEGGLRSALQIPLVWISFIELVEKEAKEGEASKIGQNVMRSSRGRLLVHGRGLFRMVLFLHADCREELLVIRDWLRFLVVRQRIPHLVLGLHFDWAKRGRRRGKCKLREKLVRLKQFLMRHTLGRLLTNYR